MSQDVKILLVEDNEGDIVLTLKALEKVKMYNKVDVVKDGEQALQYLRKEAAYSGSTTPGLILLDINLPKMDGREVLSIIKNDEELKMIPVIMLTTSESEKDVMEAYSNHANCYITKPVNFNQFLAVVTTIRDFWINTARLPQSE